MRLVIIFLASVPALTQGWCTGEFTCDIGHLYEQHQGVHLEAECEELCQSDGRCLAYTWWRDTSLAHWSQCWLFSQCEQTPCVQCVSGVSGDGCDGSDTTTPPPDTSAPQPDTTVPGQSCPAIPDSGGSLTCIPEIVSGEPVPDGTHCIFTCGEMNSVHFCEGGTWDVPPPPGCYCPALDTDGGELLCVPDLEESGEAVDGTFCIFSCDGHPVMEILCHGGTWDKDDSEVTCQG